MLNDQEQKCSLMCISIHQKIVCGESFCFGTDHQKSYEALERKYQASEKKIGGEMIETTRRRRRPKKLSST